MMILAAPVDPFDGPEWANVIGNFLTFAGVVVATLYARKANVNASAAREQVQNDHKTNLREEQDERHRENQKALRWIAQRVSWLSDMAIGNRVRIRDLERDVEETRPPATSRREATERTRPRTDPLPLLYEDIPGKMPWDRPERTD